MKDLPVTDYSPFDRQEILLYLFHPRPESGSGKAGTGYEELSIPVGGGIHIGGRLYAVDPASPYLLFFHGNGEIVEDYHDLGDIYTRLGLNFMPVDYRGYGKSTGVPTVSAMMRDCHAIYEYACELLSAPARSGPLVVMGRSLGSAPAIELAFSYPDRVRGLVVESGFARIIPLLRLLGIDPVRYGVTEEASFGNARKIAAYTGPTLVIHAEHDHIIPYEDGLTLYSMCGSTNKRMLEIKGADHNTVFQYGLKDYMEAVARLATDAAKV
ncbi:MAG: alpha/beta hydrolase [Spirochaetota bacterium]